MTFTETISRENMAWAAGLFEGEGCFTCSIAPDRHRNIGASLGMTDHDVILKFQRVMGMGAVHTRPGSESHHKRQWTWKVGSFEEVQAAMAMLWPWLCSRRREKIKAVLAKYHGNATACSSSATKPRQFAIKAALAAIGTRGTRWKVGRTQRSIAREFGVSSAYVTRIKQQGEAA